MVERGDDKDGEKLPKINLQCYDISHSGVTHFLQMLQPDPQAFLVKCIEAVVKALYVAPGHARFHIPDVSSITIVVRPMGGVAHTKGKILDDKHKEIHISADYIRQLYGKPTQSSLSAPKPTPTIAPPSNRHPPNVLPSKGHEDCVHQDARREIEGVIVHEMVHAMQYTGHESCPGGLVEGIADWVRLQADLAPPHWKEKYDDRQKRSWDSGYETTAYFLRWTSQWLDDALLVPRLNEAFRQKTWDHGQLFTSVCGKTVDEAWQEYKKAHES